MGGGGQGRGEEDQEEEEAVYPPSRYNHRTHPWGVDIATIVTAAIQVITAGYNSATTTTAAAVYTGRSTHTPTLYEMSSGTRLKGIHDSK